ncbi:MAG: hypothetical protein EOP77_00120 [Variovorax sp.]|nr:MAG: hypothetical protein EOP77_00120 [Variovorax sp.]
MMLCLEDFEVDRDAIASVHLAQNLSALQAAVQRGDWTADEAKKAHAAFSGSDALQRLIDADLEHLEASLAGQVH